MTPLFAVLGLVLCSAWEASTTELHCESSIARYRLTFEGKWSQERFPKQFPKWRPNAQWSKLVGRTHNDDYELWSKGGLATFALKKFVEDGDSDYLDRESQGFNGVHDTFYGPPVKTGTGSASCDFMAEGNYSKLSTAVRVVPSPDWFVGVDSVSLCPNGTWTKTLELPLQPIDAGTDRGFTFTSPNWASRPHQKIFQITSKFPSHRASSFFYPNLDELLNIGTISVQLMDVYRIAEKIIELPHRRELDLETLSGDFYDLKREKAEEAQILAGEPLPRYKHGNQMTEKLTEKFPMDEGRHLRKKHHHKKQARRDCVTASWSDWTPCSKTCGFGVKTRRRRVTQTPHKGRSCPRLQDERWCGSMRNCEKNIFSWVKSDEEAADDER